MGGQQEGRQGGQQGGYQGGRQGGRQGGYQGGQQGADTTTTCPVSHGVKEDLNGVLAVSPSFYLP